MSVRRRKEIRRYLEPDTGQSYPRWTWREQQQVCRYDPIIVDSKSGMKCLQIENEISKSTENSLEFIHISLYDNKCESSV
jgi:hypothetical protein